MYNLSFTTGVPVQSVIMLDWIQLSSSLDSSSSKSANLHGHEVLRTPVRHCELNPIELIWAQVKGFVEENNTTFRLKDVKKLVYGGFGRITKEVWAKAEDLVLKIEKEYGKENCIDRSEIPPIIIDFDDDESSDEES
jgi:hypothetical protein